MEDLEEVIKSLRATTDATDKIIAKQEAFMKEHSITEEMASKGIHTDELSAAEKALSEILHLEYVAESHADPDSKTSQKKQATRASTRMSRKGFKI